MISLACQWTQSPSATPLQPIKYMLLFGLCSLMISQAGWWTRTPSATSLQPKKWNPHFCITFNFWCWPDWSMDSNPIHHPSPAKKMKSLFLYYIQLLMISRAGWWTLTPSATRLQPKKWNAHFWIMFNFWWSAGLVEVLKPHPPPLSHQKNEMLIFGLRSTSDDWPGWSMDWNHICHPSPAKNMKCYFWIMFNFWWSAGLVNGLKPYPPPLSSQKSEMLIFVLHSTSDVGQTGQWTWTSSTTPPQPKNEMLIFALHSTSDDQPGLLMDLNPIHHLSPAKNNEMHIFWWCSTSDDWLGWSMDWNSLCHPSLAKNMKCYFLDYVQLLMISWAGLWTQTPSSTPLQPKKWNAHFCITFNIWCWPDWSMDLNLIHHSSPAKNMKCSNPSSTSLLPKNEMLIFGLRSTSDDWLD